MNALVPVAALLLSVAILLTGNGLLSVLLPVRASLEAFSALQTGLIASSYFAGFAAGCGFGPRLIKRVGHIRTFTAMTAVASAVALAHALFVLPPLWWALRALAGFCFAVLYIVIESWLNERATRETRGTVLSAYMIINLTVLTLGQMLLPLHDPGDVVLFAVVSMLISLAALPVALSRAIAPAPIVDTRIDLRRLYRISPVGALGCLAVGMANSAFWALGPLFAQAKALDATGVALFMSATVIGGALGQWPLGYLSDRIDRRKVMVLAAASSMLAGIAVVVNPFPATAVLLALGGLWGASAFPLYSLAIAHANDFAEPEEFVQVSSGLMLVYAAGAIVGPVLASALTAALRMEKLFLYTALVHFAMIVVVLFRMRARAASPTEEHVTFADAMAAAQTVSPAFDSETQVQLESGQPQSTRN